MLWRMRGACPIGSWSDVSWSMAATAAKTFGATVNAVIKVRRARWALAGAAEDLHRLVGAIQKAKCSELKATWEADQRANARKLNDGIYAREEAARTTPYTRLTDEVPNSY